jgi:hypothetical protein
MSASSSIDPPRPILPFGGTIQAGDPLSATVNARSTAGSGTSSMTAAAPLTSAGWHGGAHQPGHRESRPFIPNDPGPRPSTTTSSRHQSLIDHHFDNLSLTAFHAREI